MIIQEAEAKSTLKFLNSASYAPGKIHTVWVKCKHNSNSLLKAYVQVKLSCGSYILQSVRARFSQFQVSKLCPLCREADETMQHFILHCGVLEQTRHSFINEIREFVGSVNNEKLLGSFDGWCAEENHDSHWETHIFSLTRELCYALHVQRNTLLASI